MTLPSLEAEAAALLALDEKREQYKEADDWVREIAMTGLVAPRAATLIRKLLAALDEQAERRRFEATLQEVARPYYDYSLKRDGKTGRYVADFVEVHWQMWLARAMSA